MKFRRIGFCRISSRKNTGLKWLEIGSFNSEIICSAFQQTSEAFRTHSIDPWRSQFHTPVYFHRKALAGNSLDAPTSLGRRPKVESLESPSLHPGHDVAHFFLFPIRGRSHDTQKIAVRDYAGKPSVRMDHKNMSKRPIRHKSHRFSEALTGINRQHITRHDLTYRCWWCDGMQPT